ncbi:MAG: hypothetical protein IKT41_04385 [Clostridia bacterium]|nr:hypothetical protein [Clostridia bacterium]
MKKQGKRRIAFFAFIIIICTICIGITISIEMNNYYEKEIDNGDELKNNELYNLDQELFKSKFINSFNNNIIGESNNIKKIDANKNIIYSNTIKEKVEDRYDLNTNIPYINIENEDIQKYNDEIKNIFETKIGEIKSSNENSIYTVDYMANINNNILSLVIKATLKEGENSQRLILKTYNYNLDKNKEVELEELISDKDLKTKEVENKLREEIEKQNKESLELQKLGYNVFIRNVTDDIFDIKNINTFFIDSEGYIYIIYAYGNNNLTTEMDIVVF